MKKIIIPFSIMIIVLIACNPNKDYNTYSRLQGDWTDGYETTFLFKDTLCNYLSPFGSFTSFRVTDDTIVCKTKYPDSRRFKEIKFHILRLDEDSLQIEYKDFYTKKKENILFGRVKNKLGSNIQVDSVIYLMSFDSNWVPSNSIKEIDDLNIRIKNRSGYSFSNTLLVVDTLIPKKEFEFINAKFSNVDYKLVEKYNSEYLKERTYRNPQLIIYVSNKTTGFSKKFEIHNFYKSGCIIEEDNYPDELKIFMSYLDNINYFIK
ncbi:MAG TPA: hypothetical protein PKE38_00965 [Ignavibacteriaceae bacterium]|nr:hypothetical protein [Ignavibacteriaceae bacterium]